MVFVAACWLVLVAVSRGYSLVAVLGLLMAVASLVAQQKALRLPSFSSCGSQALEHRLNSCGARAVLLNGVCDLLGPGIDERYPQTCPRVYVGCRNKT